MTQHNIARSEAFRTGPHINVRFQRRRRRSIHPAVWMHLAMIPLGVGAGLIDALIIGKPYLVLLVVGGLVAWRFWPTRR